VWHHRSFKFDTAGLNCDVTSHLTLTSSNDRHRSFNWDVTGLMSSNNYCDVSGLSIVMLKDFKV
jgi:hypothetical protein